MVKINDFLWLVIFKHYCNHTNPCSFTYIKDLNNIHLDIDHLLLHLLENVIKFLCSYCKT